MRDSERFCYNVMDLCFVPRERERERERVINTGASRGHRSLLITDEEYSKIIGTVLASTLHDTPFLTLTTRRRKELQQMNLKGS
jgi:hypothetical protein